MTVYFPSLNLAGARSFVALFSVGLCSSGCELINPDEQIPAFLRMEEYAISTTGDQGYPVHSLTDAWVYHEEQLIGVYELPSSIPILSEGATPLRIKPGMRVSGQVGQRSSHPFLNDLTPTISLFPDSHVVYNPTVTYKDAAVFKWLESFEGAGLSLVATALNQGTLTRIQGEEAFAGQSLRMSLSGSNQLLMECATALAYPLKRAGAPIILEFSYRNNNRLYVGLISGTPTGVKQTTILVLNPSPDVWKHVYVSVGETVSSSSLANASGHQVFFGFIRDEGVTGEAYAIIDNIKLIE
jgi:hypothetical protein